MVEPGEQLLIEVCSARGEKRLAIPAAEAGLYLDVELARGQAAGDSTSLELRSACPYCVFHADSAGLPLFGYNGPRAAMGPRERLPLLSLAVPRLLVAWSSASPRAPPVHA